jgi:hypothetical protein
MDKRSYIEVESPPNAIATKNGAIKKKIRISEKLDFENNGNAMNFVNVNMSVLNNSLYPGFDINDLCFDDDDELDLINVSKKDNQINIQ